ncbi:hypothetical protein B0H14DRAFT_3446443 [Mycena olivaceomarginata]|nr:hypothetical protein B0H14DRAFT_3446443 [Mycena olivaceomarginata]
MLLSGIPPTYNDIWRYEAKLPQNNLTDLSTANGRASTFDFPGICSSARSGSGDIALDATHAEVDMTVDMRIGEAAEVFLGNGFSSSTGCKRVLSSALAQAQLEQLEQLKQLK